MMLATHTFVFTVAFTSQLILQTDAFLLVRPILTPNYAMNGGGFILHSVVDADLLDFLTPLQTKHLRKETAQRRARNTLKQISFTDFDDDQELLRQLAEALAAEGLVEVRAISKNSRRFVHQIAEAIAEEAGEIQTTFLVSVKGHSAVFFSPTESIPLRTTGKRNEWTKKEKPERDDKGQVLK